MTSLARSNPYLRKREDRERMVAENTYDSAIFEGASARSLKRDRAYSIIRDSKPPSKKPAKGS